MRDRRYQKGLERIGLPQNLIEGSIWPTLVAHDINRASIGARVLLVLGNLVGILSVR